MVSRFSGARAEGYYINLVCSSPNKKSESTQGPLTRNCDVRIYLRVVCDREHFAISSNRIQAPFSSSSLVDVSSEHPYVIRHLQSNVHTHLWPDVHCIPFDGVTFLYQHLTQSRRIGTEYPPCGVCRSASEPYS